MFKLEYKGQPACLAQSPQLHKQMAVSGGFQRVFEVGPVYRAEDSYTHRHLCEFTGLDVEMTIRDDYTEARTKDQGCYYLLLTSFLRFDLASCITV